jgi:transcriptional regulator of acetoin/glycerol metabolism
LVSGDFIDRVFDHLVERHPQLADSQDEIKRALRGEFAQEQVYIRGRMRRAELVDKVLRLFNGVNACEVARTLNISRATVYRSLKQPGKT